ncbi:Selenocysteine lyase/Cysteine desulfurase [Neorhodopirellula lusitana]|uniref:cysteine desulfurase n=1 Tax=Neorhodopirellula lusitana TaxID=445327 RepID=A0ABY1Q1V0_9BACT|nr:aminotransferase class V-fold PLP-dependent enzyme [Neorhodopirellula lusitana]SMP56740.1 Selenocysteine lyase/Cysteine desulfurase [Neorhodopirellula lusitana]
MSPMSDSNAGGSQRLYLDHASTSWPKREGVVEAMAAFMVDCGASPSRGQYKSARQAGTIVQQTRQRLAEVLNAEDSSCVSFQSGCTVALNVAIQGLVRSGEHVIASSVEHNSVLRPIFAATDLCDIVDCDSDGRMQVERIISRVCDSTRLIALTHASNVTGIVQPVRELSAAVLELNQQRPADRQIVVLCDAAQTFGYLPVDVGALGVQLLAAPAHKGCGGPSGIAFLYVHPTLHGTIRPLIQGGSGHDGLSETMPVEMPGCLEPGTMNIAAIAGWQAAIQDWGPGEKDAGQLFAGQLQQHAVRLHNGLASIDGIRVVGGVGALPIASIDFGPMLPPSDAAAILDHDFGIDVRAGFHCAARIHRLLGTQSSGTVRISCGHTTTAADIDRVVQAVAEIAASLNV